MPSTNAFDKQDAAYKAGVLPPAVTRRVAVEAGATQTWWHYVGLQGEIVGIDHFGASAPGEGAVQGVRLHGRACAAGNRQSLQRIKANEVSRRWQSKVGINGYGRIGRNVLRALYEGKLREQIEIVAINDLGDANTNAHLTRYDTAHGKFHGAVHVDGDSMVVNGDRIRVVAQRDPAKTPLG